MERKEPTFAEILASPAYADKKAQLAREINANKLVIDYSVFKKTPEEKANAYACKKEWAKRKIFA